MHEHANPNLISKRITSRRRVRFRTHHKDPCSPGCVPVDGPANLAGSALASFPAAASPLADLGPRMVDLDGHELIDEVFDGRARD
jgi:hypothetical protein